MNHTVGDFLYWHPTIVYVVFCTIAFLVFCLMVGGYASGQTTAAEAQCKSLGGVYGGNECYVEGEEYKLKVDR